VDRRLQWINRVTFLLATANNRLNRKQSAQTIWNQAHRASN
jgi:hypothetical protein